MENFKKFALTKEEHSLTFGGGWIYFTTSEGRGGFNDKNGNGQYDQGESWYFIYNKTVAL